MFCTNCGKEIADTSKFCPTCGNPIDKTMTTHMGETTRCLSKQPRRIRMSWIVIGVVLVILMIAIAVGRNSPENVAARQERARIAERSAGEKNVSWSDVRKSWTEAKKAKQDLDKSVDDLKNEWNGLKQKVKDAVNDKEVRAATDEFKSAVKETTESENAVWSRVDVSR